VLFKAGDTAGANALYLWSGGSASRIVGSGDTLDGQSVVNVRDPGKRFSLRPGLRLQRGFRQPAHPVPLRRRARFHFDQAGRVMNSGSYASASIAPGEVVTLFGTGIGPATLA